MKSKFNIIFLSIAFSSLFALTSCNKENQDDSVTTEEEITPETEFVLCDTLYPSIYAVQMDSFFYDANGIISFEGELEFEFDGEATDPVTHEWFDGSTEYHAPNGVYSQAVDYTLTITDAEGCTGTGALTFPNVCTYSYARIDWDESAGTLTAQSTRAAAQDYLWSNGENTESITIPNGTSEYTLTLTNVFGCTKVQHKTPCDNTTLSANIVWDESSSELSVAIDGGRPGFDYLWSTGEVGETISADAFHTSYTVTVTDANGCMTEGYIWLEDPDCVNFVVGMSWQPATSILTSHPVGGTPDYQYLWSSGQTTQTILAPVGSGVYSVTVTDANGCIFSTPSWEI